MTAHVENPAVVLIDRSVAFEATKRETSPVASIPPQATAAEQDFLYIENRK
jgi:hypothetical protein